MGWLVASGLTVVLLDRYGLPFPHREPHALDEPPIGQLIGLQIGAAFALIMVLATLLLTRRRSVPDLAARAPDRPVAGREVVGMLLYAAAGQLLGALLGRALGIHPISLHLAGTLFGLFDVVTPRETIIWAGYNFIVFAAIPYLVFRRRGYSPTALSLHSSNLRADVLVIAVLFVLETIGELAGLSSAIFTLTPRQLLLGAPLAFVINFVGAVVPIMVFVYCILLPRYVALTGSATAAAIVAGLTYAGLHVFEAWAIYDSLPGIALSVLFLLLQYVPPGIVKAVMTLRTGNAWVHVWAYHAVSSHVTLDTVNFVRIFGIR